MEVKPTYEELERRIQELEKNESELEYLREMPMLLPFKSIPAWASKPICITSGVTCWLTRTRSPGCSLRT